MLLPTWVLLLLLLLPTWVLLLLLLLLPTWVLLLLLLPPCRSAGQGVGPVGSLFNSRGGVPQRGGRWVCVCGGG
jgi:hypothetical protein